LPRDPKIKHKQSLGVSNHMATLADIEEGMRKNDGEIETCLQLYTGMSWCEYSQSTGIDINLPTVPAGMMDAADFLKTVTEKELLLNQCKEQIKSCIQQIADIEKTGALLGQAVHGYGRNNVKAQLFHVRNQRIAEEKSRIQDLWIFSQIKCIDAKNFQAELSCLLKCKLELRLSHKKSIALRMTELRGGAPAAR